MSLPPELEGLALVVAFTAMMWIPYTLALIARGGLMAAMGNRDAAPVLPAWAQRAKRAHANAVENLVLFGPAVLVASCRDPASATLVTTTAVYLAARVVHYAVYVAGIPIVRTLAFLVGWGATAATLLVVFS